MTRVWPSRFKLYRKQTGFTLVETLIAVAIISGIGIAVIKAIDTNARGIRTVDEQTQATNLVTAYLENIKQLPYSDNASPYNTAGSGVTYPSQYTASIKVTYSNDGNTFSSTNLSGTLHLQKISISVYHGARLVRTTCTFRVSRTK